MRKHQWMYMKTLVFIRSKSGTPTFSRKEENRKTERNL